MVMQQYYSQFGEDRWIDEHLKLPAFAEFLDIGANDGIIGSNTYFLERRGWEGYCVDADPRCYDELLKNRKNSLHCAVVGERMLALQPFIMDDDKSLSRLLSTGKAYDPRNSTLVNVPTSTVANICIMFDNFPFLVSIDVEGSESDVLKGFADIQPPVMILEFMTQGVNNLAKLLPMITDYEIVHTTEANIIVVRKDKMKELMK